MELKVLREALLTQSHAKTSGPHVPTESLLQLPGHTATLAIRYL